MAAKYSTGKKKIKENEGGNSGQFQNENSTVSV
jgi:hypothetical protein